MSLPAPLRLDAARLLQDPATPDGGAMDAGAPDGGAEDGGALNGDAPEDAAPTTATTEADGTPNPDAPAEAREWNVVGLVVLSVLCLALLYALVKWRRGLLQGASTSKELLVALWQGPNWWLVPVVLLLLPAALFLVLLKTVPVVAPFVYTVL